VRVMSRRRLSSFFSRRRYHDAAFSRPDLSHRTEATFFERLVRMFRKRESFAYDDRDRRIGDGLRLALVWASSLLLFWFLARSALAFNIFAG